MTKGWQLLWSKTHSRIFLKFLFLKPKLHDGAKLWGEGGRNLLKGSRDISEDESGRGLVKG
jgi:hypothetical protein